MKKLLPICVLFFTHLCNSQVVFCPPGAEWHYLFYFGMPSDGYYKNEKVKYTRDSILDGQSVKVLNHEMFYHSCEWTYITVIKQNGDTIFMRNKETAHKWQILYNFAAQPGDTWVDSLGYFVFSSTVTSVATVTINDFNLKKLSLYTKHNHGGGKASEVTERIGGSNFLFNFDFDGCHSKFHSSLCYQDSTLGLLKFSTLPCDWFTTSLPEESLRNLLRIFPNPVKDKIFIESKIPGNQTIQIRVKDVLGKNIIRREFQGKQTEIDLSELGQGIYFLELSEDQQITSTQKFIKE